MSKRPYQRRHKSPDWIRMEQRQPQALAKTVLLVDEQDNHRIIAKWFLGSFGLVVESARTAQDALVLFDAAIHAVVITENSMPGMTGVEMAHVIKLRSPSTPVIMCSALLPEDQTCLDVVIQKPVHLLVVKEAVERMLEGLPPDCQPPVPAWRPCTHSGHPFWAGL